MPKVSWTFDLNGTDVNPYEQYGLKQNPFPQHGESELVSADLALQSLGGVPLKGEQDIRERLKGRFTDEFIETVIARFKPGKIVRCHVECEWK